MLDYRESSGDTWRYEVDINYPQFRVAEYGWAEEMNAIIKGAAFAKIEGIRNIANEVPWGPAEPGEHGFSSCSITSEVLMFRGNILSIRKSIATFYHGAAHGMRTSSCLNFYLRPVYTIQLRHLLPRGDDDLPAVSVAVREQFCASGWAEDNVQLIEGTDPANQKFDKFNLTETGVLFTFDEYEVGPFCAGRQQVVVPYARFNHCLPPELGDGV